MTSETQDISRSLAHWQSIAAEHDWTVRSLTIWVDDDNNVVDSAGTREGRGDVFIKRWDTDALLVTFQEWFEVPQS